MKICITRNICLRILLILILAGMTKDVEQIRIVGSHTLYPFLTIVAEKFGKSTDLKTPIVEATGTGGGIKLFCLGEENKYPSIAAASRRITTQEYELCAKHGVRDIQEIVIGYDGIILANSVNAHQYHLTTRQLFLALAKKVPYNGQLIDNIYNNWQDISLELPNNNIEIYGPSVTSGTRNSFVELVIQEICTQEPEFKKFYPDKKQREQECQLFREDGRFIEVAENDNLMIQKLYHNSLALGMFGYNFLEHNRNLVHTATINNVVPTIKTISSNLYPISRPLYIYIKKNHLNSSKTMLFFIKTFLDNKTIGEEGYLVDYGLVPIKNEERIRLLNDLGMHNEIF